MTKNQDNYPPPPTRYTAITKRLFPLPLLLPLFLLLLLSSSHSSSQPARAPRSTHRRRCDLLTATTTATSTSTAMAEMKLIYFNSKGLAEQSRWMLKYAKIPFTDERVEKDDWPERKKSIPGGKLPVLEVDGKMLPQSMAIARFVASKAGLMPEDPLHAAFCDAVVETLKDVSMELFRIKNAEGKSEEEKQKTLKEEYLPNTLFPMLERLDKRLGDKEWFIGDKISWGDFGIARTMEALFGYLPDLVTKFPKIKAHTEKIQNLPGVKEWIATRPDTLN